MKVPRAAAVMSKTVSNDIGSQQWPGTSELVEFLLKTNNWFDLFNGAFSSHGVMKNNRRLDPYTMADVEAFQNDSENSRFKELLDYCKYLNEWKEEILNKQKQGADMSIMSELGVQPLEDVSFHALEESQSAENEFNSKCLLPHQTLLGIEMSTGAFKSAVSFLLGEGISFVNARSFCQDPLQQNFGKH
ncbi:tRNA (cytosine-5-)-methyltransferase [Frankliniella fusca]|uniref:tRNA (Cytosine-5-)-methyltransferase n=1 Tax=Frankliniella fusca TaxID=407009 RepID=A0AAE1HF28_9NEOP|nr:tRNA (cytosine-5-)-methyltransferase [Frankliniella fusca]